MSLPSMLRSEVAVDRQRWVWRTPLETSQPYWCARALLPLVPRPRRLCVDVSAMTAVPPVLT